MQNLTEFSVATLVRSLRETTVKPSFVKKGGQIDFNLENLCQYLEFSANDLIRQRQQQEAEQETEKVNKKYKQTQKGIISKTFDLSVG